MNLQEVRREAVDWAEYPKEEWFAVKEDAVVCSLFPKAAEVVPLERRKQKSGRTKLLDFLCCACTDAPDSGAEIMDALSDMRRYYLVNEEGYFLVCVGREEFVAWALPKAQAEEKKIKAGGNVFWKTARKVRRAQDGK